MEVWEFVASAELEFDIFEDMTLVIAAAQSASVPGNVSRNVTRHLQFGAVAADKGVQLLVFPELSLTGYEPAIARTCGFGGSVFERCPL